MYLYYFSHLLLIILIFHGIIIIIIINCHILYFVCKLFVLSIYVLVLTL
jgi:hypothetical protein